VNGKGRIAGLVLAGGRSSRLGSDKAVARLEGRSLLAWSLAALDGVCEAVAVSAPGGGAAGALASALGRTLVADDPTHGEGPLAGVAAGLAWAAAAGFDVLLTLPCDTPLVETAHLRTLIAARGDARGAYAITRAGPHPLCAAWDVGLAATLVDVLARGAHPSARDFLAGLGARAVVFEAAGAFANVNRPEDLAAIAGAAAPIHEPVIKSD